MRRDCGTILIVDSNDADRSAAMQVAVRAGLNVWATEHGDTLLERLNGAEPCLAIVEVELPGVSGLEVMRDLHERFGAALPVLLVSSQRTDALDRTAGLMLGAEDYLEKPVDRGELLARIRRSLRRAAPHDRASGNGRGSTSLSPREREILELLAGGRTQKDIALALVLSPKTVATHIQHVLSKLGVHSRAEAVAAAYRRGLVDADVVAHLHDVALVGVD